MFPGRRDTSWLLATGSYDGQARIWNYNGESKSILKHKGPLFSLMWNTKGDYILTGSFDKIAIVRDWKTQDWKRQFEFYSSPTLDLNWRNNVSFATSSNEYNDMCEKQEILALSKPLLGIRVKVIVSNGVQRGTLLTSYSDDITAKLRNIHDQMESHWASVKYPKPAATFGKVSFD